MTLQPQDTQVIFCDMHQTLLDQSVTISPVSLTINSAILAELCCHFHLPTTFLTVPVGAEPKGIIDSLQFLQTSSDTFHRLDADPFKDNVLTDHLARKAKNTIVVSGFSTEIGVMFTALGALQKGYRVIVAVDVVGSRSTRTENAMINYLSSVGVEILPLATIAVSLQSDFTTLIGKKVLSCISRIMV